MKIITASKLITVSLLALLVCSCSRSASLSVKVNGSEIRAVGAGAEYCKGRLHILGGFNPTMNTILSVYVKASTPGIYPLNSIDYDMGSYAGYSLYENTTSTNFISNSQYTGRIQITKLDTVSKRVSGTFEFDAAQILPDEMKFGTRIIHVTSGKFSTIPIEDTLKLDLAE